MIVVIFFFVVTFARHGRKSFQDLFLACSNAGQAGRRAAGAAAISASLAALSYDVTSRRTDVVHTVRRG
jgi:hypothetical protein